MKNPRLLFADMPLAIREMVPTPNFDSDSKIKHKGVHVKFENGRILSLQAHPFNYSSTREDYSDWTLNIREPENCENWYNVATSVEIATWIGESSLQEMPGGDTVMGWVDDEKLERFVREVLAADKELGLCLSPLKILGEDWD